MIGLDFLLVDWVFCFFSLTLFFFIFLLHFRVISFFFGGKGMRSLGFKFECFWESFVGIFDKLESFFCTLYEFLNPVSNAPVFLPAEFPPRYAIDFVPPSLFLLLLLLFLHPAMFSNVISDDFPTSTVYSVVSSANFAPAISSPPHCITTTT